MKIKIKTNAEIALMKKSATILSSLFDELALRIQSGVTTKSLDDFAYKYIIKNHAKASFKGVPGMKSKYPATLCISINNEVIHGIPSSRTIEEGDIVSVDAGVLFRGYHSDSARTYMVGNVATNAKALVSKTEEAFYNGVSVLKNGVKLGDLSEAIQTTVEEAGYSIVKDFTGHGIGSSLHEPPQVPNYGKSGSGPVLKSGMVIAVEPMVNEGRAEIEILEDGWTVITADGSLSSHYEHTVLITDSGFELLTASKNDL